MDAFRGAVDETMREIESEMKTRVRRKGAGNDRVTGNMTWAEFIPRRPGPSTASPIPSFTPTVFAFNATWDERRASLEGGPVPRIESEMLRTSRRRFGCGWPTGSKSSASAFNASATTSRSPECRPDVLKRFSGVPRKSSRWPGRKASLTQTEGRARAETREKKERALSWDQPAEGMGVAAHRRRA